MNLNNNNSSFINLDEAKNLLKEVFEMYIPFRHLAENKQYVSFLEGMLQDKDNKILNFDIKHGNIEKFMNNEQDISGFENYLYFVINMDFLTQEEIEALYVKDLDEEDLEEYLVYA